MELNQGAQEGPDFVKLIDLISERVGGKALFANDEFFAPRSNLLKPGRGVFIPGKFTDRGKWMDGWETRRKRGPGHDYCIIKLGIPGIIKGVNIDTNHFLGNNPLQGSIDAIRSAGKLTVKDLNSSSMKWKEILPPSNLKPGSQNFFDVKNNSSWTHIRFNIFPDGGVARLRLYGMATPDFSKYKKGGLVDLAAVENGGIVELCNDMFFGAKDNIIMPGRARNMGDGWETRRRRGPGFDWIVIRLGHSGIPKKIEVDTNHFKGNFPDECSLEGCHAAGRNIDLQNIEGLRWQTILDRSKLKAHARHFFEDELKSSGPVTHVRLNIFPDGGVSRLRIFGQLK